MLRKKAESVYQRLVELHGFVAPDDLHEGVLRFLIAERLTVDFSRNEIRLRLGKQLANGVKVLKARALTLVERQHIKSFRGDTRATGEMPVEEIRHSIAVMNDVPPASLEGLSDEDAQMLAAVAGFLA